MNANRAILKNIFYGYKKAPYKRGFLEVVELGGFEPPSEKPRPSVLHV